MILYLKFSNIALHCVSLLGGGAGSSSRCSSLVHEVTTARATPGPPPGPPRSLSLALEQAPSSLDSSAGGVSPTRGPSLGLPGSVPNPDPHGPQPTRAPGQLHRAGGGWLLPTRAARTFPTVWTQLTRGEPSPLFQHHPCIPPSPEPHHCRGSLHPTPRSPLPCSPSIYKDGGLSTSVPRALPHAGGQTRCQSEQGGLCAPHPVTQPPSPREQRAWPGRSCSVAGFGL